MTSAVEGVHGSIRIPERRKHPSAGFLAVCATYLAVFAFLAWGLSTPALDRVWTLHHELKVGRRGSPKAPDLERMRDALERYPGLAGALLPDAEIGLISAHREGWLETPEATVLRTRKATQHVLQLEVDTPLDLLPFAIDVDGEGWQQRLEAKDHGVLEVKLPDMKGRAELIVVRLRGKKLRADPSVLNVRLSFTAAAGADTAAAAGAHPR